MGRNDDTRSTHAHVVADRKQGQHAVGRHWQTGAEQSPRLVDDDELARSGTGEDVAAAAALDGSVVGAMQSGRGEAHGFCAENILQGLDVVPAKVLQNYREGRS